MARDHNERVWIGGGAVATLLLAGGVWAFVVSPQLSDVDSLKSQTADAQVQNAALQGNVSRLKEQYSHIDEVKQQLSAAQQQLPSENALSEFTSQLNRQAAAHHVSITQFTAANPAPVASSTASGAPAAAPSSAAPAAPGASAASGLYAIQVSVAVAGRGADELAFAQAVQKEGPRAALVTSVQVQNGGSAAGSGTGAKGSALTLQMDVFVAPPTPTAAPSAAAATPTPSATPTG